MEQNKLEKDFRKKLNDRTIQPSEMSWDRLDAMLSVAENKKPKRTWLFIAASFLGFLLVGTLFFRQSQVEVEADNAVVVTEEMKMETKKETIKAAAEKPAAVLEIISSEQKAIVAVKVKKKNTKSKNTKLESTILSKAEILQEITETKQEIAVLEASEILKPNKYIESESLLAEAETKLQTQPAKKYVAKSNVKVNSKDLLSSVEGELDDTFREKVIRSINKNYESVKTSLANRNHE